MVTGVRRLTAENQPIIRYRLALGHPRMQGKPELTKQDYRLVLASQSPRRKMLLTQAGYEFEVIAPPDWVECGICSRLSPAELVAESSFRKAKHVSQLIEAGIVLAADTVAECGGEILGKPVDREHARRMLKLMGGREHRVLTGVTLWQQPSDKYVTHIEQTLLKMDVFDEAELEVYLESGDWFGKAGAFGYQDGLDWVHIIEGSSANVVGLPIEWLNESLLAFVEAK